MQFISEKIINPDELNFIFGQSHFIKTVEDLYEIMINTLPNSKFGIAFNEASGPRLIRKDGNDMDLIQLAVENIKKIGAGHTFIIFMKDAFPINVLPAIKNCREVAHIFCATANPTEVLVAETEQGRGVMGVVDGYTPLGTELDSDVKNRKSFLRKIGYKR